MSGIAAYELDGDLVLVPPRAADGVVLNATEESTKKAGVSGC